MTSEAKPGAVLPDTTALEGRVQTQERGLSAFIAAMSERMTALPGRRRARFFDAARSEHIPNPVPGADGQMATGQSSTERRPGGVRLRLRNGIWEVSVDGAFHGDYHQKDHALEAMADVRRALR